IPATCRRPVAREPSRSAPGIVIKLGNMGPADRIDVGCAGRPRRGGGYHGSPDGLGREALPALPGRPGQGQGSEPRAEVDRPAKAPYRLQARPTMVEDP